jgi:hypothetical protein
MREMVKKEVIKLLDTRIIYPVPHSEWVRGHQVVRHQNHLPGAA